MKKISFDQSFTDFLAELAKITRNKKGNTVHKFCNAVATHSGDTFEGKTVKEVFSSTTAKDLYKINLIGERMYTAFCKRVEKFDIKMEEWKIFREYLDGKVKLVKKKNTIPLGVIITSISVHSDPKTNIFQIAVKKKRATVGSAVAHTPGEVKIFLEACKMMSDLLGQPFSRFPAVPKSN